MLDTVVALCNTAGLTSPYGREGLALTIGESRNCFWEGAKVLRKLMVLLGLLAAMMLVASPVLAWQPGPGEGNRDANNYYPASFYKYCEPGGSQYYGDTKAANPRWCYRTPGYGNYYTEYQKKTFRGKQSYWVHVYYQWRTPDGTSYKMEPGITASITSTMTRSPPVPISRPGSPINLMATTIGSRFTG